MQSAIKTAVMTILTLLPRPVFAQEPIVIDFDDLSAPCALGEALPLRDEYAALGVVFLGAPTNGGAAVLDERGVVLARGGTYEHNLPPSNHETGTE